MPEAALQDDADDRLKAAVTLESSEHLKGELSPWLGVDDGPEPLAHEAGSQAGDV